MTNRKLTKAELINMKVHIYTVTLNKMCYFMFEGIKGQELLLKLEKRMSVMK
jgi:hypothetical protein